MNKKAFIFWSLLVGVTFLRSFVVFGGASPFSDECVKQKVSGMGEIVSEPEEKETGQVFVVNSHELKGETGDDCGTNVRIRLKTKVYPKYEFGEMINFTGKLSKPYNFRSDDGRTFNYEGFLAKDDVYYEMKSATIEVAKQNDEQVQTLATSSDVSIDMINHKSRTFSLQSKLFAIKKRFVDSINRVLGEPHSALAAGLVVGEKAALGKDLLEDFRIVGLIHIVVLSGFNITIIGEALRKMLVLLPRVWGIVVGGIGIGLFGVLVGGGATVVRSCFMATIALSADLIRRDYSVFRALIFAGLVMLILNPRTLLYDPSFQLSFLATAGLILLASPIEGKLIFITEKFGIRGIVASTLATQVFVSPFILHMMGQISIIGMIVNILVLPFVPITMLSVFLTGFLGMMWYPLSIPFGWMSHLLLSYELFMVETFAKVPYASVKVPMFSYWWVVGFYVVFILLLIFFGVRKKRKGT